MQKYAAEAYKTAGVGANDYMNQVTSFAASLVSSLGGDTAKAAEMGNQAIIDMSDNANKMGTDIQTIQQTYQSLARGNYAMLDNLKLGYGGTKTEMQRLIADANKLPGVMKEGNDLSIDSFADVTEAISRVQKSLGISGTTAKEAATTIEGSVNSMKAAWQNWLAGLGNENADMGALSQQLADSIGTALKNILPRVKVIAQSVVKAIPSLFSDLVTLLPEPFQNAINAIGSVFNGLGEIFKPVQSAIAPLIAAFMALGAGGIAPLLSKIPLLGGVLGGLSGPLSALGGPIGIVVAALGTLIATVPELRNAFGTQVTGAFNLFKNTIAGMKPTFDAFGKSLQDMFKQVMPVITLLSRSSSSVRRHTPVAGTAHPDDHRTAHERAQLAHAAHRPARVQPAATVGGHHRRAAAGRLADRVDDSQVISQLASALVPVIQQVMDFVSQLVTAITPLIQQLVPVITDAVSGITGIIQQLMPVIQSIISVVGSVVSAIIGFITGTLLPAVQAMLPYVSGVIDCIQGVIQGVVGVISGVISMVTNLINGNWSGAWNSFKSILSNAAGAVGGLVSGIVSAIKGVFAGAGSLLKNAGSQLISGLWNGISGAIGGLYDKIKGALSGLVDKAKEALGIHSPSRVFRDEVAATSRPASARALTRPPPHCSVTSRSGCRVSRPPHSRHSSR